MTKFGFSILNVLYTSDIDTRLKAMTINQILELIPPKERKSYVTVWTHLQNMIEQGYVQNGFMNGQAATYYITETGKMHYRGCEC